MQRPHFQNGRLLRTSDFVDEQAYHLTNHRRHNATGHVWGVASGLDVVLLEGDLVVEPGSAVDGYGRDVVLGNARSLDLRGFDIRGIDAIDVWIVYDRRRVPATGQGVDLLADAAAIELTDAAQEVDPRRPPGVDPAELGPLADRPGPDDPARRWPIYLGRITRDLAHPETPPVIEPHRRPFIGLVGATVETPDGSAWLTLTTGDNPSLVVGVPGAAEGADPPLTLNAEGMQLNSHMTIDGALVLRGGSLILDPAPPALATPPSDTKAWSFSHAEDLVAHELRVAMPPAGSGAVTNRLVIGVWKDGDFAPSLVVDEGGTVTIAGNLIVGGQLRASSVQQAQLSTEARAYLAGLQAASLLSLFQVVAPDEIN